MTRWFLANKSCPLLWTCCRLLLVAHPIGSGEAVRWLSYYLEWGDRHGSRRTKIKRPMLRTSCETVWTLSCSCGRSRHLKPWRNCLWWVDRWDGISLLAVTRSHTILVLQETVTFQQDNSWHFCFWIVLRMIAYITLYPHFILAVFSERKDDWTKQFHIQFNKQLFLKD